MDTLDSINLPPSAPVGAEPQKGGLPFVVALAGNPNAGKSTVFNALTGARQHVGNYPGVTVEKKEGTAFIGSWKIRVIDLPGTYSLSAYTQEEVVARKVLAEDKPEVVIFVANAAALERNMYLAVQIMEMGRPVALALNMMDEVHKQGLKIDMARMAELLGAPVVGTVARTGQGLREIFEKAVEFGSARAKGALAPLVISYGQDLDPVLQKLAEIIDQAGFLTDLYPARWIAMKYLEGDEILRGQGFETNREIDALLREEVERVSAHLRATLDTSPDAVISDYRYGFINSLMRQGVLTRHEDHRARQVLSDRIDQFLTHRLLGPLFLIGLLYLIYQITFSLGEYPMEMVNGMFGFLGEQVSELLPDGLLKSLLVSGIIEGVGGVLVFVPLIMIMFLLIAVLEDTGYMARIAYMLDRIFRLFGLHGCSVMPFIVSGGIAGGCAVPGVMASRTLRSRREKLATLLTAPFMACGAKLPVFLLIVGVFFSAHKALVMFGLTMAGWVAALLVARLLRSSIIRGPATPFVMELPPYRLPTLKGLLIHTCERTWEYLRRAGTVILAVSILLWAAMTFPRLPEDHQAEYDNKVVLAEQALVMASTAGPSAPLDRLSEELEQARSEAATAALTYSLAGRLGKALEPVSQLAGFDWKTNLALIGGTAAKEVVVSTLGTAYSLSEVEDEDSPGYHSLAERIAADPAWSKANAASLLIFVLLYAPCIVTLVAIRQESGTIKWALFSLVFNTGLAFSLAVVIYQVCSRL